MIMMVKMIVMMMVIMMILIIMMIMIVMRMRMIMITSDFGLLNRHRPQPAISARQSVIILTISGRSNSLILGSIFHATPPRYSDPGACKLKSFRHFASSGSCSSSSGSIMNTPGAVQKPWNQEHSLHANMVS